MAQNIRSDSLSELTCYFCAIWYVFYDIWYNNFFFLILCYIFSSILKFSYRCCVLLTPTTAGLAIHYFQCVLYQLRATYELCTKTNLNCMYLSKFLLLKAAYKLSTKTNFNCMYLSKFLLPLDQYQCQTLAAIFIYLHSFSFLGGPKSPSNSFQHSVQTKPCSHYCRVCKQNFDIVISMVISPAP